MEALTKIIYYFGKFWLAVTLFVAMVISTIISLPFIIIGKTLDFVLTSLFPTRQAETVSQR